MTIAQAPHLDQPARTIVRFLTALFIAMATPVWATSVWATPAWAEPPPPPALQSDHPLAGRIWEPASGRWASPSALVEEMLGAGIVLLGESHDNPDHHALQAWAVRQLAAAGRRPLVVLEMVGQEQQAALDGALGDLEGLGNAVEWEKRGWPAWSLYRPIAQAALSARGEIKAGNLPQELARRIGQNSQGAEVDGRFGLDQPLPPAQHKALETEIREGHCGMLPDKAIPPMARVQRARDGAMAEVLADQAARPEAGPAVLIAGAVHVRTDRGVPASLHPMVPGIRVLSIAFVEVEAGRTAPAAYGQDYGGKLPPFDLVWFTARQPREDQCAAFEKHMKKKEKGEP